MPLHPDGKTRLIALIGDPISHARAPEFVNPILLERGIDAYLIPLHVPQADLASIVRMMPRMSNLCGLLVTIPHKEALAEICDELGPHAKATGAVNVVRFDPGGKLVGDIFDGTGMIESGRRNGIEVTGRKVLVVGTGGAGRAIAFALADAGVTRLGLANRTAARAEALAADVRVLHSGLDVAATGTDATGWDVVVNATSLGLHAGDPMPLDPSTLAPSTDLIDIIAPRDTEIMDHARALGCRVIGGRPMIECQFEDQMRFLRLEAAVPDSGH
jgi:shikimate dehydrogenase